MGPAVVISECWYESRYASHQDEICLHPQRSTEDLFNTIGRRPVVDRFRSRQLKIARHCLRVSDPAELSDFYTRVLGMRNFADV